MAAPLLAKPIKNAIIADLKKVAALKAVISEDLNKDALDIARIASWPVAIVGMPSVKSVYETNRDDTRQYIFDIMVLQKSGNTSAATDIEDLLDQVLFQFDNDPTLGGASNAGVGPAEIDVAPISTTDKTYIGFLITIKAKVTVNLTF